MDKLQAIRYFITLANTLSFKKTAAHYGVPPSSVSRSIKALEVELGAVLVQRTTRQVRLTELGEWYRGEVVGPLRALSAADEMLEARAREVTGTLRITALPGYGEARLLAALARFRTAHPRVVCDLELTDRYLDLSTGDIDLAVRATADPPEYLIARRLHAHRFVMVASPNYLLDRGHPRTIADLQNHDAIVYRGPTGIPAWSALRPDGTLVQLPRTPVFISNHGSALLEEALAGHGLCVIPAWGVAPALADGSLVEITLEDGRLSLSRGSEMSIYLLYHPRKARLGKVRAAVAFLTAELKD